ncbi:MAG: protease inhibitor I9 family protein [Actinobacteria bacterium]|nr:protease inhibitor I9 family protein [Actinomycetota bacterium]
MPGRYIVVFRPSLSDLAGTTKALERSRGFQADRRYSRALKGFAARLSDAQAAALQDHHDVELVTPGRPVHATGVVGLTPPSESPPPASGASRRAPPPPPARRARPTSPSSTPASTSTTATSTSCTAGTA